MVASLAGTSPLQLGKTLLWCQIQRWSRYRMLCTKRHGNSRQLPATAWRTHLVLLDSFQTIDCRCVNRTPLLEFDFSQVKVQTLFQTYLYTRLHRSLLSTLENTGLEYSVQMSSHTISFSSVLSFTAGSVDHDDICSMDMV